MASAPIVANFSLNQNKLRSIKGRKIEASAFKSPIAPKRRGGMVRDTVMAWRRANGRLTAAEALGHREFVMTRLYRSA